MSINIYCDESCHLPKFNKDIELQKSMVLGAISCLNKHCKEVNDEIKNIKEKHGINRHQELKWTKVSNSKLDLYLELINYFFENDKLSFRAIVFPDKNKLNYAFYSHDDLYYLMYLFLLREMISINQKNCIYIDKKDTRGGKKVERLKIKLGKEIDIEDSVIEKIQIISSNESQIMQLTDIFIGAISYINRGLNNIEEGSYAKSAIVEKIKERTHYSLLRSTLRQESKFNMFFWKSKYSL